jgi:GntR family transcriptional regulator
MYKQVADHMAQQIISGDLPPGSPLPSESELIAQFGVSRQTVRAAVAEMRAMGLVDSSRGRRSAVRGQSTATAVLVERAIHRKGKTFDTGEQLWEEAEPPTVTRTDTTGLEADLLGGEGQHTLTVERLLTHPPTGTRAAHRIILPFAAAENAPALVEDPERLCPVWAYAELTAAGSRLTWREIVSARAPRPDERSSLGLTTHSAPILLITHRVTLDQHSSPLMLEELRLSADHARLSFTTTATKPPAQQTESV